MFKKKANNLENSQCGGERKKTWSDNADFLSEWYSWVEIMYNTASLDSLLVKINLESKFIRHTQPI